MTDAALAQLAALVSGRLSAAGLTHDTWDAAARLAVAHGLGPMLLWAVRQDQDARAAGLDVARLVEDAQRAAAVYLRLERAQRQVNDALAAAGIPALWLKGAALAVSVYPQPTLRPMDDLDVLVPHEQGEAALRVMQGIGFDFYIMDGLRPVSSGDALHMWLSPHHYHLKGGLGSAVILELHTRLLSDDDRLLSLEHLGWFWEHQTHLRTPAVGEFAALAPEAHLLYLCAHAELQHGEAQFYLLRYFDLHRMIAHHALDWEIVIDQAVALGWTFAVERALRLTAACFATPIASSILDALVARRPAWEDVTHVTRIQAAGFRWERLRARLAALPPHDALRLAARVMFPSRAYMRQRYRHRPGWPFWWYYVYRWYDQALEISRAVWRRLRSS
jgi:hypothetical protein